MASTPKRVSSTQRDFLAAIDRVVYGNPFSDERERRILELLPGATTRGLEGDREALARLTEPVVAPFRDIAARDRLPAEERELAESGLLYVCYHRHVAAIDRLIERHARRDDASPREVADAAIGDLVESGFDAASAAHYFALFFQLRRSYYFIVRSLAGRCESMRRLRQALWDNVFTHDMRRYRKNLWSRMEDFSTLILGETGTGKGSAAAAIGRSEYIPYLAEKNCFAASFADSFISINLTQYSEALIESELFGHRKGAFTGAIDHHLGVLERCSAHGALLLDEIGDVSIPLQIKLLQVLQERSFTPVGSHERRRFAGRVIAATNRPLAALRAGGSFRDDFYYRLCSDVIQMPTLRQRIEELPGELADLVSALVARIAGAENAELDALVLERLERDLPRGYPWPGNVRELEQAVRGILLTGKYSGDLDASAARGEEPLSSMVESGQLSADELLGRYCAQLYRRYGTYAEVAERARIDRRTARRYVIEYGGLRQRGSASAAR